MSDSPQFLQGTIYIVSLKVQRDSFNMGIKRKHICVSLEQIQILMPCIKTENLNIIFRLNPKYS